MNPETLVYKIQLNFLTILFACKVLHATTMHIKHTSIFVALLLASSFNAGALNTGGNINPIPTGSGPANSFPNAKDDHNSIVIGEKTEATGNVIDNDLYGTIATFNQPAGKYGFISTIGSIYTYKLYTSTDNSSLPDSGVDTESFSYTLSNDTGLTDNAQLKIQVNINPAFSQEQPGVDGLYDNVDVEFNDRSAQATSLNSGRNIKGHLYNSSDKDWFSLDSAGNEIITLEVCPRGTSCFEQKSWVLYIFDPDRLTLAMEEQQVILNRWLNEIGSHEDLTGQTIIGDSYSNHMYLAYKTRVFDGALIGIVDPCFGSRNTVDIRVPPGAKNYLIAISSPLKGDSCDAESCGVGSVILEEPGRPVSGHEPSEPDDQGNPGEDKQKTYETTQEFIVVSPNSDDQYAIKITGTGLKEAISRSSFLTLDQDLIVSSILVGEQVFKARLGQTQQARSAENNFNFILTEIEELSFAEVVDAYRAVYNPDNQQVMIPLVTVISTDVGYSVVLQYHVADDENTQAWFEVLSAVEIK